MAIWAGIVTAVVGAGLSAGLAYASQPNLPDPERSSASVVSAALRTLPGQRAVDAAAALGIPVDYPTGRLITQYDTVYLKPDEALARGLITPAQARSLNQPIGRPGLPAPEPVARPYRIPIGTAPETRHADFTGLGDADVQGALARNMAKIQLDLQKKYGTQFVDEARAQQEAADPEGAAARRLLASEINRIEDERQTRERPVATTLDRQMLQELEQGGAISPEAGAEVARELQARAQGGAGGAADTATTAAQLESGPEGEARRRARMERALGYLESGATPEDVQYRERQQSLANMASFLAGRTPESQFSNLSGGQQGATPNVRGPALPTVPGNLQQIGTQAGLTNYTQGVQQAATQVNPWFAGLSAAIRGAGAYQAGQRTNA